MTVGSSTDGCTDLKWVEQYRYGQAENDRLTFRATLVDLDSYSDTQAPTNAMMFAAWFGGLLSRIPVEHRGNAVLSMNHRECDECSSSKAEFVLYVERPETDDEYAERMEKLRQKREKDAVSRAAAAARKAEAQEQHDRAEFDRLKKKFGA